MSNSPEIQVPDAELDYDDELTYKWQGKLFTGIGVEDLPDGGRSEISYRYGTQEGLARDWYPSGVLKGESNFHENVQHGPSREYAEDGALTRELFYEYGILVERREVNASGVMERTFAIDPSGGNYSLLERYRREKGWPLPPT